MFFVLLLEIAQYTTRIVSTLPQPRVKKAYMGTYIYFIPPKHVVLMLGPNTVNDPQIELGEILDLGKRKQYFPT